MMYLSGFELRNQSRRSNVREPIRCKAQVESGQESIASQMRDLSANGAFVALDEAEGLHVGNRLDLTVVLPGSKEEIRVRGTIRWIGHSPEHGSYGCGIELDAVNAGFKQWVQGRRAFTPK